MTGFGGLVALMPMIRELNLRSRLNACFDHMAEKEAFRKGILVLLLILLLMLGFRRLRSLEYLRGDPMVERVLGVSRLPSVPTMSRMLSEVDERGVEKLRVLSRSMVIERLVKEGMRVVTLDFDGSVMSTRGHAEGSAVGFNRKKKGARSYYPLFCTVSQTGQFFDLLHRPGNIHDSNGAADFMKWCYETIKTHLPGTRIETRVDAAFFNEEILDLLSEQGITFSASVPFERFPELKARVEATTTWRRINDTWSFAEVAWKPKVWKRSGDRFLLLRKRSKVQISGPLQLDLFVPRDYRFEYKVIVTNRIGAAAGTALRFHNGRGSQEKVLGEGKQDAGIDLVPVHSLAGNRLHIIAAMLAHNLGRELQMASAPPVRRTNPRRAALWVFHSLRILRETLFRLPGRLIRPSGVLTLVLSGNTLVAEDLKRAMVTRKKAA